MIPKTVNSLDDLFRTILLDCGVVCPEPYEWNDGDPLYRGEPISGRASENESHAVSRMSDATRPVKLVLRDCGVHWAVGPGPCSKCSGGLLDASRERDGALVAAIRPAGETWNEFTVAIRQIK